MLLPPPLRKRNSDTHKGDYGRLLILGGSPGLTGAICLASEAALKIGAGLVTVGIPESLNSIFEIKLTEVMSLPLTETRDRTLSSKSFKGIKDFSEKIDVLAIGCGAARHPATQNLILRIAERLNKPMVIDADGVNALASKLTVLKKRRTNKLILTPHLGEFARLIRKNVEYIKERRKELAKHFSLKYNLVLVLKGHRTIITDGKKLFENKTGNPGMATAGSGDVLTGIISGLVAQGIEFFEAAKLGVYLHGLSADIAAKDKTPACLIASDIIEYLPRAIKSCG